MNRKEFLKISSAGLVLSSLPFGLKNYAFQGSRKPNIILILVDDMGYEVLSQNGGISYQTPNIDKLAKNGMKFTNCYSAPVCSPSRTELLTGRYTFRTGEEWGVLPDDEITVASLLQNAGYKTAVVGKWQFGKIGDDTEFINKKGFDEYCCWGWHEGPRYWNPMIWENGKIKENISDKYGPDVLLNFSIDFMKRSKDQPFFLYYPMVLTHFPKTSGDYQEPPGPDGKYQTYSDMVENCDRIIGEFAEALEKSGLAEDTILIFTTDNGTPSNVTSFLENEEIKGGKRQMTDAGTHVPLIINWKNKINSGSVNSSLVDFTDYFPTLLNIAEYEKPDNLIIDGKSFAPQLKGNFKSARDWVYQEWQGESWIRNHEWKLYRNGNLFDMFYDTKEENPFANNNDTHETKYARELLEKYLLELDSTK